MKCNYCDYSVKSDVIYCPNCGEKVTTKKKNTKKVIEETSSVEEKDDILTQRAKLKDDDTSTSGSAFGWGVLGFFLPFVGFILFLVWINERPKDAKGAGIGALIKVIIRIILFSITMFFSFYSVLNY